MRYDEKIFEFTNIFHTQELWFDGIQLIQVGETCLNAGACVDLHTQICHEISYVISGKGILEADGSCENYSAGDIQIISNGKLHCIRADCAAKLRFFHFGFMLNESAPKELKTFFDTCPAIKIHDSDKYIKTMLELLVSEFYINEKFGDTMKKYLVHMIIILIWRLIHTSNEKYLPLTSSKLLGGLVYNIILYIESHPADKLSVTHIAEKFSYSPSYISHLFKEKTGTSIQNYIIRVRMEYAKKLINEQHCSLEETAALCGYKSTPSFARVFKKYTGS